MHAMKRIGVLLLALVFFLLPYPSVSIGETPSKGILVCPQEAIQTSQDVDTIVKLCKEYRINTIFLKVKQDTGPDSGLVYFDYSGISRKSGFDVLREITTKIKDDKDITTEIYAWVPVLYDSRLAAREMSVKDSWICPMKAQSFYKELIKSITGYGIQGILFDYLHFPDDISASAEMLTDFGEKHDINMNTINLQTEKEQNSTLWKDWIQYRQQTLVEFLNNIAPESVKELEGTEKKLKIGIFLRSQNFQNLSKSALFDTADFVAAPADEDPVSQVNQLNLLTESAVYIVIPNHYISEVRTLLPQSTYADFLIFDSNSWGESDFQRIQKAEIPLSEIRMSEITFIDFFNDKYDMNMWGTSAANAAVLPAGNAFSTYFKLEPHQEQWSHYIQKYDRDYVQEMIFEADDAGLHAVLELNVQSEEYVIRHKDTASVTYQWSTDRKRVCLTELISDPYRTEFFETAVFLAETYDAEAILITNIGYLEDCFCSRCLESYIDFMAQENIPVEDWPRKDGEIDIYNNTIREWKTAHIIAFLRDLREEVRGSNKELWVKVPVSSNLEYASSEYGLHLPELEPIVDKIVLVNITIETPSRMEYIVNGLPTSSMYILYFFVPFSEAPARAYLVDSLEAAYNAGIESVGIYPHSTLNVNLWAAFYKGYTFKLALDNEDLMELYNAGEYNTIIDLHSSMMAVKKEEQQQNRDNALESIKQAQLIHKRIPPVLEEAKQLGLDMSTFEGEIQENENVLSEAETLFIEEEYQQAEQKGKRATIEFSTLHAKIENQLYKEWIKRITAGVITLVVFLLVMMYVRFTMHRRK